MAKNKKPKIERTQSQLLTKLIHHLELLIDFSDKAFYEYRAEEYIGEVAGKLRLLVIDALHNKPLLLGLMDAFKYERTFNTAPRQEFTLRSYIYCLAVREQGYKFRHEDLIRATAEQMGAGHEDWGLDEDLHKFINGHGARSCDSPFAYRVMRAIVNTVLSEATLFLYHLHKEGTLTGLGVKYNLRQILGLAVRYGHGLDWNLKSRKEKELEWKVRPTKELLQAYDILHLKGESRFFLIKIQGLTPKEEFEANGHKEDFWMQSSERYMGLKERRLKEKRKKGKASLS